VPLLSSRPARVATAARFQSLSGITADEPHLYPVKDHLDVRFSYGGQ
jgi:hypothetical protein